MSQKTMSFCVDDELHSRLITATEKLGLNTGDICRDALIEKLDELESFIIVSERGQHGRKPIDDVWNELGLNNNDVTN